MDRLAFTIPLAPRTKKNSMRRTRSGKMIPSKPYIQYRNDCKYFIKSLPEPINHPVNVQAIYYMDTKRVVDLTNLLAATNDILVDYGVLADDNKDIIASHDGSRVYYDKDHPRTEIIITEAGGC